LFPIGGSNEKEIEQQGREGEVGGRGKEEECGGGEDKE
jgi:hypothetical protein